MSEIKLDIVPQKKDVVIMQGDTFNSGAIEMKNAAGDDVNLSTGYEAEIVCADGATAVLDNDSGGEDNATVVLANGSLSFGVLKAATAAIDRDDRLPYQIRVEHTAPGGVATVVTGQVTFKKSLIE